MFRKGQIEMIGLVIVVILLSIGLLFYVKFGVFRQDNNKEDAGVENAYLNNLMGAILNVKVCNTEPVKVDEGIIKCFNSESICGEEACEYLKNNIGDVLGLIGLKKYKNYSIWLKDSNNNKTIIDKCKTGILTHTTIVSSSKEHYTLYFRVC